MLRAKNIPSGDQVAIVNELPVYFWNEFFLIILWGIISTNETGKIEG